MQKAAAEAEGSSEEDDAEELARQANELDKASSKPKASGFAGMMMAAASSSEEEEEEEQPKPIEKKVEPVVEEGKKKKKKNKKRKKKAGGDEVINDGEEEKKEISPEDADEMAFLDEAIKKNYEEKKTLASIV